jgi:hypothetical protein
MKPLDSHHVGGDAHPDGGNPLQARCGASRRSGLPCKNPPVRGRHRCRMHGGIGDGRPPTTSRYTKTAEANVERVRILLFLLQELNPGIQSSGWFRPPRGDRDPATLIEKYRRLTRQVEVASRPRGRRRR